MWSLTIGRWNFTAETEVSGKEAPSRERLLCRSRVFLLRSVSTHRCYDQGSNRIAELPAMSVLVNYPRKPLSTVGSLVLYASSHKPTTATLSDSAIRSGKAERFKGMPTRNRESPMPGSGAINCVVRRTSR